MKKIIFSLVIVSMLILFACENTTPVLESPDAGDEVVLSLQESIIINQPVERVELKPDADISQPELPADETLLPDDKSATRGYTVTDAGIAYKYGELGGSGGILGNAITNTIQIAGGYVNHFQYGSIYRKNNHSIGSAVYGGIRVRWSWLGWESGQLGWPETDQYSYTSKNGESWQWNRFDKGWIFWEEYNNTWKAFPVLNTTGAYARSDLPTLSLVSYKQDQWFDIAFKFSGQRYTPGALVTIYLCSPYYGLQQLQTAIASSSGTISTGYTLSSIPPRHIHKINGTVTFLAEESTSQRAACTASYVSYGNEHQW